jgi:hypothetical protein
MTGTKLQEEKIKLMGEHVSRAKFEDFFRDFKDKKVNGDDKSWADEVLQGKSEAEGAGDGLTEAFDKDD